MSKRPKDEPIRKPYGYVLVLRGLAKAAIKLAGFPASLRVLVVAAEYMDQDAVCRVGQDTIAARLGVTRQTVNRHFSILESLLILESYVPKDGVIKSYSLDVWGLEDERAGQDRVDKRRKAKREAKRTSSAPVKTDQPESDAASNSESEAEIADRQCRNCFLFEERPGYEAYKKVIGNGGNHHQGLAAMEAFEREIGEVYRVNELPSDDAGLYRRVYLERREVSEAPVERKPFAADDLVSHSRFGTGLVTVIDGDKITVSFAIGEKKVVAAFLEPAGSCATHREGAASEAAEGAAQ